VQLPGFWLEKRRARARQGRFQIMFAPPQLNREELLDEGAGTLAEVRRSLRDIERINTFLGGAKPVCDATWHLLETAHMKSATIVDVGTGSADIPRRLVRGASRRNLKVQVVGLDLSTRHLRVARETTGGTPNIALVGADAFRLPFADQSVDVVLASLFLHHFRPAQIEQLLAEFSRVSRVGWIMNDLVRAYVPLWFFRLTRPIFARSFITRHDGEASIRRGYTPDEMARIVKGIDNACVHCHFPYRMSVVWTRQPDYEIASSV
jgi:SAM-dependent methyltransferase